MGLFGKSRSAEAEPQPTLDLLGAPASPELEQRRREVVSELALEGICAPKQHRFLGIGPRIRTAEEVTYQLLVAARTAEIVPEQ